MSRFYLAGAIVMAAAPFIAPAAEAPSIDIVTVQEAAQSYVEAEGLVGCKSSDDSERSDLTDIFITAPSTPEGVVITHKFTQMTFDQAWNAGRRGEVVTLLACDR